MTRRWPRLHFSTSSSPHSSDNPKKYSMPFQKFLFVLSSFMAISFNFYYLLLSFRYLQKTRIRAKTKICRFGFLQNGISLHPFLGGFEPPAFRLGGERSILLSYRNLSSILINKTSLIIINDLSHKSQVQFCFCLLFDTLSGKIPSERDVSRLCST